MSDPIIITREIVKRGWTDFEPKIITGLLTGGVATFITGMLTTYDIHVDATSQKLIVVACYFLGAYLTPSSGQTFTRTISKDLGSLVQSVEQHTGATVTTVTGAIPVQAVGKSGIPESNSGGTAPVAVNLGQDSVTQIIGDAAKSDPISDPTVAYARGQAFFGARASNRLTSED